MDIAGDYFLELRTALIKALSPDEMDAMLVAYFGRHLYEISTRNNYEADVDQVIFWADRTDQEAKLVGSAYEWNPSNRALQVLAQKFLLSSNTLSSVKLEKIVNDDKSFLDVNQWIERLAAIEGQICRVEIDGTAKGTGFLVGPDIVITNHHVVAKADPDASIAVRFDYKIIKDENDSYIQNAGTVVKAVDGWLLDSSPYSQVDLVKLEDKLGNPELDELDYALLQLSKKVGNLQVGKNPRLRRGWVNTKPDSWQADEGDLVFIFQHPKGEPMKLNFDTIDAYNDNRTRVRYKANTRKGSSGSPCFDRNWNLVALHHSGEKSDNEFTRYNEGIPLPAIRALLEEREKLHYLGQGH